MSLRGHFIPPPFHDRRPNLVAPVRTDPSGLTGPTPGQARGPHWRRTSRGFYVPASADRDDVEQRTVEAAAVLPRVGGVTGWAALRWHGGTWFDGRTGKGEDLPVDLATCYDDIRNQSGIHVIQERLGPRELIVMDGLRTTSPARSVCLMMRYARDVREAVVVADMAAFSDLVSRDELAAYFVRCSGWTGIPQARDALLLMDENSWSPWETWLRLVWQLDGGFPPPLSNWPIFDRAGNHVATPDLLDLESGTYGEYDGGLHLERKQRSRDIARADRLRNLGLEGFTILATEIPHPEHALQRMIDARRRARWEPVSRRQWTTDLPPWWTPTNTVELRRQLTARQRERWLRRRSLAG